MILNTKQRNLTDKKIIIRSHDMYLAIITPLVRITVYPQPHPLIGFHRQHVCMISSKRPT